jgi:hypothetical protein
VRYQLASQSVEPGNLQPHEIVIPRWIILCGLVAILTLAALIRVRLLGVPLERDEGEYAYAGQLMLQGVPPYKLAYNMKLPGTYAAYALIMAVFGQTGFGIHVGLLLVNSVTTVMIYFLGCRLFGKLCGLIAAASFAVLSVSHSVLGFAAHATHFVTLFGIAGSLFLLRSNSSARDWTIFVAGLFFGLAFVMKQSGLFLGLFGVLYLLWNDYHSPGNSWYQLVKRQTNFCAGGILPFLLVCLVAVTTGMFQRFWFWTFSYAREYAKEQSASQAWQDLQDSGGRILHFGSGIWTLAAIGLWLTWTSQSRRSSAIFLNLLAVASLLAVSAGLHFREHYFIVVLPAAAVFMGAAIQILSDDLAAKRTSLFRLALPTVVAAMALALTVYHDRMLFFKRTPNEVARAVYGVNPFPESPVIARYIRQHSSVGSRIAVIGSEPQIYFYSRRHSATGYIYTYALTEPQKYASAMKEEMIHEVESAVPEFVVLVHIRDSWFNLSAPEERIFDWAKRYTREMAMVGLVQIDATRGTTWDWNEHGIFSEPVSQNFLSVYKWRQPSPRTALDSPPHGAK